jgi:hypothetical protein
MSDSEHKRTDIAASTGIWKNPPPMEPVSIGSRILAKVIQKLGGLEAAASHLQIHPALLRRFVEGHSPTPDHLLLRAVDFVLGDEDFRELISQPASQSLPGFKAAP